jgi:hypothetical protein
MPEHPDRLALYSSEADVKAGKPVAYAYWDEATGAWTTPPIGAAQLAICPNCERCTWNPGPDCGRAEHAHCERCEHCIGRHVRMDVPCP